MEAAAADVVVVPSLALLLLSAEESPPFEVGNLSLVFTLNRLCIFLCVASFAFAVCSIINEIVDAVIIYSIGCHLLDNIIFATNLYTYTTTTTSLVIVALPCNRIFCFLQIGFCERRHVFPR
jgi:hypothetical protein